MALGNYWSSYGQYKSTACNKWIQPVFKMRKTLTVLPNPTQYCLCLVWIVLKHLRHQLGNWNSQRTAETFKEYFDLTFLQAFVDNRQKTTQFQATVFFAGLRVVSGFLIKVALCSRNIKQSLLISMVLLLDELIVARNAWGHLKMNMKFSAFGPNSSNFVGLSTWNS